MMQRENVHIGHRARMRDKFLSHGANIFDTYELLEMLLYTAIPLVDTNPIAKRLLMRFGSLDGVLNASPEELTEIDGVGEKCARFLHTVGQIADISMLLPLNKAPVDFSEYDRLIEYATRFFDHHEGTGVAALMLDGRMRLLRIEEMGEDMLSSCSVRLESFIDLALTCSAQHIIILMHHRYGALYPTEGEFASLKLMRPRLLEVGVNLTEALIVGDGRAISVDRLTGGTRLLFSSSTREYQSFIDGKKRREEAERNGK